MVHYQLLCAGLALINVARVATEGDFCKKDAEEDCGKDPERKFRKTALITGGSGFVAHHVIEVTNSGQYAQCSPQCPGDPRHHGLEHRQHGQVGLLWEAEQNPGHVGRQG